MCNGLTMAQRERLALLLEELGEAQQAIGKILRHGFLNYHPDTPEITNKMNLERELGHIAYATYLLWSKGDIESCEVDGYRVKKAEAVGRWLYHQKEDGRERD